MLHWYGKLDLTISVSASFSLPLYAIRVASLYTCYIWQKRSCTVCEQKSKHTKLDTDYIIFWTGYCGGITWSFMNTVSYLLNYTLTMEMVFTLRKQVHVSPVSRHNFLSAQQLRADVSTVNMKWKLEWRQPRNEANVCSQLPPLLLCFFIYNTENEQLSLFYPIDIRADLHNMFSDWMISRYSPFCVAWRHCGRHDGDVCLQW